MNKTYMTLFLGGQERGLKFNFGTLRFIGDLTGSDPLLLAGASNVGEQFKYVKTIIHAALMSNYLSMKKQIDFTEAELIDWISELSMEQATSVTTAFAAAFSVEATGKADTQQQ